ncbi:TorD/DmsD family molecular chaperone [Desulfitobacterium hafniense]|uniref:TorD/DmsD family molecular chaperone n=1 Tax=Desulfitobacterium hafniense TaxID=49338 RepID=UPI000399BDCA|nr:molecular chaperone TorD family protein [Desulfitobacterium hafniense]
MDNSLQELWVVRAKVYGFLGSCILEPLQGDSSEVLKKNFGDNFPLLAANSHMESGLAELAKLSEKFGKSPLAIQEVQLEYTTLFLGPGLPKAPPWESIYRTQEKRLFGEPTYEVREVMARNGFEGKGKNRQPEDHMGLELILLSAMAETLNTRSGSELALALREQLDFIVNHPLTWIADLHSDAAKHGDTGFYAALIKLIWGVLLWDKELLEEVLAEM